MKSQRGVVVAATLTAAMHAATGPRRLADYSELAEELDAEKHRTRDFLLPVTPTDDI